MNRTGCTQVVTRLSNKRGLIALALVALVVLSGSAVAAGADQDPAEYEVLCKDELVYNHLGSELASIELVMERSSDGSFRFTDATHYPSQTTDVVTRWQFDEIAPSPVIKRYEISVVTPGGRLDAQIVWGDEITYEVAQTGTTGVLSPRAADPSKAMGSGPRLSVIPLDNNAIADYVVAAWLLDSDEAGARGEFGLVLPVSLVQHSMILDSIVEYLGSDSSLGREALKYKVSVGGTGMFVWTTPDEKRLMRLEIPSQGVEIVNKALLSESETDVPQVVEESSAADEGEVGFVEMEVLVPAREGELAATLSLPADAAGDVPGLVIVAGSGPTDRDGNNPLIPGKINTYKEIADYLASRGVAVLRYDKRGIGGSVGLAESATPPFSWYADDAQSCVEFLKSVDGIDPDRVYLAGHSEGGVLSLMALDAGCDVAGLILLSAPGYPLHETLRWQIEAQGDALEEAGMTGIKEKLLTALDDLYEAIRTGGPFDYSSYGLPQDFAQIYLSLDLQREFAEGFLFVDPVDLASRVDVPVCIIQGTADTQVSVDNALAIVAAVDEELVETHIVEGVDHVLKPTQGEPLPYGGPSRKVSPEVLEVIEGFVKR